MSRQYWKMCLLLLGLLTIGCNRISEFFESSRPHTPLKVFSSTDPTADFQSRCAGPGVLVCEGFDDPAKFAPATDPNSGLYPSYGGNINVFYDQTVKSSGAGSARFYIPPNYNDDMSGFWMQNMGASFGAHSTFYVQFRFRMDTAMQSTNWEDLINGGSSPKIAIFHHRGTTCGSEEITTNNRDATSMPMMYTDCGARGFYVIPGTTNYSDPSPPLQWQNGYYNCAYPETGSGPGGCFTMPANTWMTFYYEVSLGGWGQPNSHVTAYVGVDGQPLQKFIDVTDMALYQDGTNEFDSVTLLNYMTAFGQIQPSQNPAANSWYDELIISTQPIPAPAINGGALLPPPPVVRPLPVTAISSPANGATVPVPSAR